MALVATHDWPNDMDNRQQRPHNNAAQPHPHAQDRDIASASPSSQPSGAAVVSVANPNSPPQGAGAGPSPYTHAQQPPYGYAHAQPPWNIGMGMNMTNMPMGPQPGYFPQMQFYHQHFPQTGHPQQVQQMQGSPYFDPNTQFAQWAYQQMMFNAQQSQQLSLSSHSQQPSPSPPQMQHQHPQQQQIGPLPRSGSHSNTGTPTNEYYQSPFAHSHSHGGRFQSGNPPPAAQQAHGNSSNSNNNNNSYQGFHPYRRPERGDRQRSHADANSTNNSSNNNSVPFQPPYARSDAAGSTSSVNSTSSASQRSRTNSGTSANGSVRAAKPPPGTPSSVSGGGGSYTHSPRSPSGSSSQGSVPRSVSSSSSTGSISALSTPGSGAARTQRPSPLSQGSTFSAAERRKSRDDSDLAAMLNGQSLGLDNDPTSGTPMARSGLKGRLRRALSFNAVQTLKEENEDDVPVNGKSGKKSKAKDGGAGNNSADGDLEGDEGASIATKKTKKSMRLFNARFNASTDNISLSSTVSSASVMIRKLGSMGRLARRNSLAGITSLFKDKNKDDEGGAGSSKKNKGKASKAEASVSMVTAEIDKSNEWSGPGMEGLSPAAKLARQHTLKSNAEAAARAKAQQEAQAAAAAANANASSPTSPVTGGAGGSPSGVVTWERNTATKHGTSGVGAGGVREDGMRVVVEEDSDDEFASQRMVMDGQGMSTPSGMSEGGGMGGHFDDEHEGSGSDEDSTWHGHVRDDEDEEVTIRIGMEKSGLGDVASSNGHGEGDDDDLDEPWALNIRRSVERTRKPAKGILKNAALYSQGIYIDGPNPSFAHQRVRANSYDSVPNQHEAGPLARMPSPDPDHIDGLHRRASHRSSTSAQKDNSSTGPPLLPPLSFETTDSPQSLTPPLNLSSTSSSTSASASTSLTTEKHVVFNHPMLNNSEPALSTMLTSPPTLTHRSATSPVKRLAFATNLSIYDTFSPSTYDRRSEPATWSRLTPALAQKIKEELNSYKMEEMEVHASSRIHTQFFV